VIGRSPHLHRNEEDGWVKGFWLFNDYARHADYHGAYMRHLLKRSAALLLDHSRNLHVCSGALLQTTKASGRHPLPSEGLTRCNPMMMT
jgi:hypothetical protein